MASQPQDVLLDSVEAADLLARLPSKARAVLTLRIVHGLAFRDVAVALGISVEAAKKRAQRALRDLRKQFFSKPLRPQEPAQRPASTLAKEGARG